MKDQTEERDNDGASFDISVHGHAGKINNTKNAPSSLTTTTTTASQRFKLNKAEQEDIKKWKSRVDRSEVYSKHYSPFPNEIREMNALEKYLNLSPPSQSKERRSGRRGSTGGIGSSYGKEGRRFVRRGSAGKLMKTMFSSGHSSTNGRVDPIAKDGSANGNKSDSISKLFYPTQVESSEPKSIVLKRGPVLLRLKSTGRSEERELILLTRGFVVGNIVSTPEQPDMLSSPSFTSNNNNKVDNDTGNSFDTTADSTKKRQSFKKSRSQPKMKGSPKSPSGRKTMKGLAKGLASNIVNNNNSSPNNIESCEELISVVRVVNYSYLLTKDGYKSPPDNNNDHQHDEARDDQHLDIQRTNTVETQDPPPPPPSPDYYDLTFSIHVTKRRKKKSKNKNDVKIKRYDFVCSSQSQRDAWIYALRKSIIPAHVNSKQRRQLHSSSSRSDDLNRRDSLEEEDDTYAIGWQHSLIRSSIFSAVVCDDVAMLRRALLPSYIRLDGDDTHEERVNNKDEYGGYTALHLATIRSRSRGRGRLASHVGVLEALLEAGADPNAVDDQGNTPLYYADIDCEIAKTLIDYGAIRTNEIDGKGELFGAVPKSTTDEKSQKKKEKQQDHVKSVTMSETMSAMKERGERIEKMDNQTKSLKENAKKYKQNAKALKEKMKKRH